MYADEYGGYGSGMNGGGGAGSGNGGARFGGNDRGSHPNPPLRIFSAIFNPQQVRPEVALAIAAEVVVDSTIVVATVTWTDVEVAAMAECETTLIHGRTMVAAETAL